jgi:hypothetical protein
LLRELPGALVSVVPHDTIMEIVKVYAVWRTRGRLLENTFLL